MRGCSFAGGREWYTSLGVLPSKVSRDRETARRFRFVPAARGTQLQDRHPLDGCILRPSMGWNPLHASPFDPQFLAEHRDFGFQLMDSGVSRITILDQRFAASEHGDSYDADDIQYRTSNVRVPVPGKSQCLDIFFADSGRHGASGNHPPYEVANGKVRRGRHDRRIWAGQLRHATESIGCAGDGRHR